MFDVFQHVEQAHSIQGTRSEPGLFQRAANNVLHTAGPRILHARQARLDQYNANFGIVNRGGYKAIPSTYIEDDSSPGRRI